MTRKVTAADVELAQRYVAALQRLYASPAWILPRVESVVLNVNEMLAAALPELQDAIAGMQGDR